MLKLTISFCILLSCISLLGQEYFIDFTGSGQSNVVDSIIVKNLSQETEITINGDDTLYLTGTFGIRPFQINQQAIKLYPNPMVEQSTMEVSLANDLGCNISIVNTSGREVISKYFECSQGNNLFKIKWLGAGTYCIYVNAGSDHYSSMLMSNGTRHNSVEISFLHNTEIKNIKKTSKDSSDPESKNIVQMKYSHDDWILFKGYSGNYARYITMIPEESQNVNFEFIDCIDDDGNHYAVVTIGKQTWMAENLKVSSGGYPYNYNNTLGDIYGLLYSWNNANAGCPSYWHLPNDNEWEELVNFIGGYNQAQKLKEDGEENWWPPNPNANHSGFTALPGGYYNTMSNDFRLMGETATFWGSAGGSATAYYWEIRAKSNQIRSDYSSRGDRRSVRCKK